MESCSGALAVGTLKKLSCWECIFYRIYRNRNVRIFRGINLLLVSTVREPTPPLFACFVILEAIQSGSFWHCTRFKDEIRFISLCLTETVIWEKLGQISIKSDVHLLRGVLDWVKVTFIGKRDISLFRVHSLPMATYQFESQFESKCKLTMWAWQSIFQFCT